MGDIADSLLDGEFDCVTGEYIGDGVGYPRTLTGRKNIHYNSKPKFANKSWSENTRVVWSFLKQRGIAFETKMSSITKEYGGLIGIESGKTCHITAHIRSNKQEWNKFKKWFDSRKSN